MYLVGNVVNVIDMSRNSCSACTMIRSGVKTRIPLVHSCGLERGEIPKDVRQKREEMSKETWIKNVLCIYPDNTREETEELYNRLFDR